MKKLYNLSPSILISTLFTALLIVSPALAQGSSALVLRLSRDFGFSSGTGQIQGSFTIHVTGPANMSRVDFLIDGKQIGEVTSAPFNLSFTTGSFSLGSHTISAMGFTNDGQEINSPVITAEFVSPSTGLQSAGRILIPILVIAGLAVLVSALLPVLTGKGKMSQLPLGAPRNYGFKGGGICPRCGRPFSFSLFALNLPMFRFDRCPFCGRWGVVRMASLSALRDAETAELESANASQPIPEESEEEKLRKELDDSRFQH